MKPLKSLRTTASANPGWLRRLVRRRHGDSITGWMRRVCREYPLGQRAILVLRFQESKNAVILRINVFFETIYLRILLLQRSAHIFWLHVQIWIRDLIL